MEDLLEKIIFFSVSMLIIFWISGHFFPFAKIFLKIFGVILIVTIVITVFRSIFIDS